MNKLNEEILDTLYDARASLEHALSYFKEKNDGPNMRLNVHKLARLDRVWDYFRAQQVVEEYRRDDLDYHDPPVPEHDLK